MRKTTLAIGAAAAVTLMVGGAALAQQAGARGDADGDGRISRSEFVDGRIGRLTAIDANRDGSVSAEEFQSGVDTRRNQRVSARFEALDNDGNGAVSREEFTAEREMRGGRHRMAGHRGGRGGMGGHRRGERGEARGPISVAEIQTRMNTQFDRIDADHDGFVTATERQTARQAMRGQRQERRAERMARRATQASPSAPASE
ncbi:MAG: EF-hand domain-containing protein [Alphaproteobacteria bacterium]|nr:EF-hand domain-containing protein [Alphaproteobacteria bacterium]MBU2379140.1 EF-hand domain-containing protein [Alphaproteobacteria bacterium]